jgi:RNA polymerase sigma-70 factor (ECF subfamily)
MVKDIARHNEDLNLSCAVKKGDREAFGKIYDQYAPLLNGVIIRVVKTESIAEEILQATFLHIWNQIHTFEASQHSLLIWMMQIARRLAVDTINVAKEKNLLADKPVYDGARIKYNHLAAGEAVEMVIFDLVYNKGLSCREAAATMQMSEDDIKINIRLALKSLMAVNVI